MAAVLVYYLHVLQLFEMGAVQLNQMGAVCEVYSSLSVTFSVVCDGCCTGI